ncbi:MAG: MmgE/PrpD family protein [Methanobacterium sp.]|nr:MmgE/PrpD family protein [Methanobacterium sp.]
MITAKLTEYINSLKYEQLPETVVTKAKQCFIDFLGVALRGSETDSGKAIKSIINTNNESTVIGEGKSSAIEAGLANGIFAHSLDLDDGHRRAQLHPGTCVMPAALSICEARNKTGKELIESIVVGYQIAIVVGMLVNPAHRSRGFHSTGTCGTFGAAAAASKAMNLKSEKIINALGLAGTQAAGLLISDHSGSMGKHIHAGKAAQSGILSSLLAEKGFTGSNTILEGKEGFISSMTGINPYETDLDLLMNTYRILEVYFKIYPVCRHLHSSIDAMLDITIQKNIKPKEIEKIRVNTYKIAAEHNNYQPLTSESLKQSLPVSMAVALFNNYYGLDNLILNYTSLDDLDNEISDLSQKIKIEIDDAYDEQYPSTRPSRVSISTKKEVNEKIVDLPLGEPENPLDKSDICGKFLKLNPKVDIQVMEIIENMDSYNNINNFMDELNSFLL